MANPRRCSPCPISRIGLRERPIQCSPIERTVLTALYALTPAEARVADLLWKGMEVQEVANSLAISVKTARFHTKRVLTKTGTRRQAELMRLMLSLPAI